MKKLLTLFFIFYPFVLFSQPAIGDGSAGNPYSGVITTPWTLSGDQYCGDLTVTGGTFTINAGATLRFGSGNSLTISGTGVLSAVGNSSSYITFTAAVTSWGHIAFSDPTNTGNSSLDYCIIQSGSVTGSGYTGTGGGILIRQNNVSVSNSIIRNNSSDWGGGIFIDNSKNPHISKCLFKDNTTIHGGGAIYCWNGVSSIIENCIFDSNHCTEPSIFYYTGGAISAQILASIQVINCTFVNNTSTQTEGQGILLQNSSGSTVINCIFWGASDKQIYCYGTTTANIIINCAYRGITYSSGSPVNPVILNSNNSASDGPNFVATDGSNWSITLASPCRDAGISAGAPATDFLGNGRVGPYDIGAYEDQYSKWNGSSSTDWTNGANWDGGVVPAGGTSDVIIPSGLANYPISSTSINYTIGAGHTMILNPGAKATLGTLLNFGKLKLESDISNISSLIVTSFSKFDATIELFLTGGNPGAPTLKLNKWHYISSPVSSLPVSTFSSITQNIVGWYDNQVSGTLATGWIGFDGYRYSTGGLGGPTFSNLTPGTGYDYYAGTDQKYTFLGQLNTSNVPVILSFNANDALHGFNLLGNPYSSGLNWDDIVNEVYFPFPPLTSKAVFFTRNNTQCTYVGGVGIPSDVTGIIPPMQGFFVKTYAAGNTFTIPAGARTQGNIHAQYKKGLEITPLVRLVLTEGALTDETLVRFDAVAKSGVDYDFDALKLFLSPDVLSIYSTTEGSNLAINGQPFPQTFVEIPIVVNLLAVGSNTITATQLQGLDNYDVTLIDNVTGIITNLKTTPTLTFSGTTGTTANRFILKVGTITTGIENPIVSKNIFNIYPSNNMINIQTISDVWDGKSGSIKITDVTGRIIESMDNSEFTKNSLTQIVSPGKKGIYMVEIKSGMLRYVRKVIIR